MPLIGTEKDKFIQTMRQRHDVAEEGWRDIYSDSLEDMKFVYNIDNAQWPDGMNSDVMLTANDLQKSLEQIRTDLLQNQPRLKVVPVDDFADVQKAELINDLMRQDDNVSNAEDVRANAFIHALSGGIGYYRIITKRLDPISFDQSIVLKRIRNPHSVLFDPAAIEFNKEDADFCFIQGWMKREKFNKKYPNADAVDFTPGNIGMSLEGWFEKDKVLLAEYYYKVKEKFTLARIRRTFENGFVDIRDMELTDEIRGFIKETNSEIIAEEESFKTKVKWAKMSGLDILEETDWVTDDIPVIPVQGNEVVVDGKTSLLSFHRGTHDLQRMKNFFITQAVKVVSKTPDMPFLATEKQIEGHEKDWSNPGDKRVLLYNQTKMGKPTRERPIDPPVGLLTMIQTMTDGIERHLGRSDPSNGAPSSERSGRAKQILINQANKATFIFLNNYMRAVLYEGKLRLKIMPKVYDTARAKQIRGEDGETRLVNINAPTGEIGPDGRPIIENDLGIGKFDLIPVLGASSESRREEQREGLKAILQYAGNFAPAIIPAILELEDLPNQKKVIDNVNKIIEGLTQVNSSQPQSAAQ